MGMAAKLCRAKRLKAVRTMELLACIERVDVGRKKRHCACLGRLILHLRILDRASHKRHDFDGAKCRIDTGQYGRAHGATFPLMLGNPALGTL
jgi:hypothetical protein